MSKFRYDRREGEFLALRRARLIANTVGLTTMLAVTACSTPQYPRKLLSEVRAEQVQKLLSLKVLPVGPEAAPLETAAGPVAGNALVNSTSGSGEAAAETAGTEIMARADHSAPIEVSDSSGEAMGPIEIVLLDPVRPTDAYSSLPGAETETTTRQTDFELFAEPVEITPPATAATAPADRPIVQDPPLQAADSQPEIATLDPEANQIAGPRGARQTPQTVSLLPADLGPVDLFPDRRIEQSKSAPEVRAETPAQLRSRSPERATVIAPTPRFETITAHSDLPVVAVAATPRRRDQRQSDSRSAVAASAGLTEPTGGSESNDTAARHPEFEPLAEPVDVARPAAAATGAADRPVVLASPLQAAQALFAAAPRNEPKAEVSEASSVRSPKARARVAGSALDNPVLPELGYEIATLDPEASQIAGPRGAKQTPQTASLLPAAPRPVDLFQERQTKQGKTAPEVQAEPPAQPRSPTLERATAAAPAPRFETITAHSDIPMAVVAAAPRQAEQRPSVSGPAIVASAGLTEPTGRSEIDHTATRHPDFEPLAKPVDDAQPTAAAATPVDQSEILDPPLQAFRSRPAAATRNEPIVEASGASTARSPAGRPHAPVPAHDDPALSAPILEAAAPGRKASPIAAPRETAELPQSPRIAEMRSTGSSPSGLDQDRRIAQRVTEPKSPAETTAQPPSTPPERAPAPAPNQPYGVITAQTDTPKVVATPAPRRPDQPRSGDLPDTLTSGRGSEQTDISEPDHSVPDQESPALTVAEVEARPFSPLPQPAPQLAPQLASTTAQLPKAIEPPPPLTGLKVEFGPGSSELPEAARGSLTELAQQLSQSANPHLRLSAFATEGDLSAGQARRLSLSRLFSVRDFLIKQGLRGEQMDLLPMPGTKDDGQSDRVDLEIDRS